MRYSNIIGRIYPCYVAIRVLAVADDEVQLPDDKMAMGVGKMGGAARGSSKYIHTSTVWLFVHMRGTFGTSYKNSRDMYSRPNLVGAILGVITCC